jgi:hypothetical protein
MSRLVVVTLVLFSLGAGPALAADGNGLYKPYPAPAASGTPQAYYAQLGVALTRREVRDGAFTGGLTASRAVGPSLRAGATHIGLGYGALAVVALLALATAGVAAARRPAATGTS